LVTVTGSSAATKARTTALYASRSFEHDQQRFDRTQLLNQSLDSICVVGNRVRGTSWVQRNIEPGFGYVDADEGEHIFHNRTSSLLYTPPLWLSLADDAGLSIPGNCSSS
jgi:hypothetical protein